jgi:septum formation protein
MRVILASSSPRRRELLEQIGLAFEIVPPGVDEKVLLEGEGRQKAPGPLEFARLSAMMKARDVFERTAGERLVIGADTIVVLGREILGKPENKEKAREMLQKLSGTTHKVITGLAVLHSKIKPDLRGSEITSVTFRKLPAGEIENYIASGEPLDKAGAYGIQGRGAMLVKEIKGCYFNVVGLPLVRLASLLKKTGLCLFEI